MQADPNPSEGDLAVVYREEVQPVTEESEFDSCTFPNTVVLKEAFTGNVRGKFRAVDRSVMFDGNVSMSSSRFRFDGLGESSKVRVEYTSQDGITYTRTDGGEELQEFGTTIKWEPYKDKEFNNVIGNFMKIRGNYFEGLYKYALNIQTSKIHLRDLSSAVITVESGAASVFSVPNLIPDVVYNLSELSALLEKNNLTDGMFYLDVDNNLKYSTVCTNRYIIDNNGKIIGIGDLGSSTLSTTIYDVDLVSTTLSNPVTYPALEFTAGLSTYSYYTITNLKSMPFFPGLPTTYYGAIIVKDNPQNQWCEQVNQYIYENMYVVVPTQLSAVAEYVYETIFYGKNGVENGALAQNISNSFNDTNADIYSKIQQQYNNISPRVLTDSDKSIDNKIFIIPVKSDGTPLLDTSNVTNMQRMFENCSNLTIIPLLDTSKVTDMENMFNRCSNLTTIPLLNTSNVTDINYMFGSCTNLTTIPELNTSNVKDMRGMFSGCTNLTTIPELNTSNAVNMNTMFGNCKNLTTIPLLDTSSVTDMNSMFGNCTNLTTIPELNTSSVTDMSSMFENCTNLTVIPLLNTNNVTNMAWMFDGCTNLTTIPLLDTSSVTNMNSMFNGCTNLTTIPLLNISKVTLMYDMFLNCTNLTDDSLNIIMQMCINATSYTKTKTLKYIGLTQEQANKCKTLSNYSAFTAAGWKTGY